MTFACSLSQPTCRRKCRLLRIAVAAGAWAVLLCALATPVQAAVHLAGRNTVKVTGTDTDTAPANSGKAAGSVLAQYVQTALTSHNGLPENSVRSIAQSTDGYVWLATEEGLVRYDGSRTRVFDRSTDSVLRNNFIQTVSAAPDGNVWVSTRSGVSRYANGAFQSHAPNAGLEMRLVFCDRLGTAWVGTDHGLYTVAPDNETLLPFPSLSANADVREMVEGHDGSLWVATSVGLWHIAHGVAVRLGPAQGLPAGEVKRVTLGEDDSVWMATATEVLHWKGTLLGRMPIDHLSPHARVSSLLVEDNNRLWVGMDGDGIAIVQGDRVSHYRAADGLPADAVKVLHKDRDGNIWVGFNGSGAIRFHAGLFTTYGDREGMSQRSVWTALTALDGSVWTATSHLGLNHLLPDGRVERIGAAQGMPAGLVYSIFEDKDSSLWVGTDMGDLIHLSGLQAKQVRIFHNPAHAQDPLRAILRGPDGDLFLLYHSELGLTRFKQGQFLVEPRNIPGLPTTAAQAPDGSLWIGTEKGGVTNWNHGIVARYSERQGLIASFVEALMVDGEGTAWVGSASDGLSRIRNGKVTTYLPANGLHDYTVGSVTDDLHGYLWMTSNKGIYKVSKAELNSMAEGRISSIHSTVYGLPDGMRSAECNYDATPSASLAPNGRLWFPTTDGLATILPGTSTTRSSHPVAVMEGMLIDGQRQNESVPLETTAGAHDVEFDFTAPDFAAPERLHFRYKLMGFDRDWVDAGHRRQAFYTRLPPGKYTLLVQAADGNGWPTTAASMAFVLQPHFWQTTWFRLLAIGVVLLCGWGGNELRVMTLRRSSRLLQEQVVVRTAALQEAMREAEAAQHELQELATRDSMTRLWNRRHIFDMLSNEANRAEREKLSLCVLLLDVDHFKQVNDTHGHLAGDRVLQAVSNVLIEQTRPYDCAGRYGGEEFLVILCNCSIEHGLKRADSIREAIAAASVEWNGQTIGVSASFGVALHVPGKSIEAVLDDADRALYRAKQTGRNRVCSPPVRNEEAAADAADPRSLVRRSNERRAALKPDSLRTAWDFA